MDTSLAIITIYVIVETILKKLIEKPRQEQKLTDIEIITIGISASLFFNSNHGKALCWLKLAGYFPKMLSKSRFNRRMHNLRHEIEYCMEKMFE